jgi:FtsH-binding integral membrane protein
MKYLLTIISLVFTCSVMAHGDHSLVDDAHIAYHIAFWTLCALVAYKGLVWFKSKKASKPK